MVRVVLLGLEIVRIKCSIFPQPHFLIRMYIYYVYLAYSYQKQEQAPILLYNGVIARIPGVVIKQFNNNTRYLQKTWCVFIELSYLLYNLFLCCYNQYLLLQYITHHFSC